MAGNSLSLLYFFHQFICFIFFYVIHIFSLSPTLSSRQLKLLNQNLGGYKFDIIDGIPSYKAGADAAWVPFSNPEVYFAQYSFPANQGTITFTPKKASLWLLTNGDWFSSQYQAQLKLQINGVTVPFASFKKYNNCYIAKYDTKQYINSGASLVVDQTYVAANAYNYIILLGV